MGFHYSSLSDICRKTKSGELRVVNVVETMLQRIQDLEPSLSAYVTVTADEAIQQAEVLDARQREGAPLGVLHGAPIGLKDLLWTKGIPTSGGMHMHREWCPEKDAAVVERLDQAGAVSLGKLKLTEGAYADHHPGSNSAQESMEYRLLDRSFLVGVGGSRGSRYGTRRHWDRYGG